MNNVNKCFKCKCKMYQCKSEYGYYYRCSNCGRIIEFKGQKDYNSQKYSTRYDYVNKSNGNSNK